MAAITVFQPEYWSAVLDRVLRASTFTMQVANTNVVRTDAGDKMHILGETAVSVVSTPATTISYSTPTGTDTEFTYNVDRTGAFKVKDIERRQADIDWQAIYGSGIQEALGVAFDSAFLSDHASWTDNYETGTTPWTLGTDGSDIAKLAAAVHKVMDDANLPAAGRYMGLPPFAIQALRLWLSSKGTMLGDRVTLGGFIGNFFGFEVFMTNNLTNVAGTPDNTHGIAGVRGKGVAAGMQISPADIEILRDKDEWANFVRARLLAGYKVYNSAHVWDLNLNADSPLS